MARQLAELGLLPKVFGQDLSGVFRQRYSGHITVVPKFRTSEMIGLKAFMNPTIDEMVRGSHTLRDCLVAWPIRVSLSTRCTIS
jgi:hypothetical protein